MSITLVGDLVTIRERAMRTYLLTTMKAILAICCAIALGGFSPTVAQPLGDFPHLEGYPHRIDIHYTQEALVCPIRSRGVFGWTNRLNVDALAPENAAGAVLWQEPERGVMLYWEHPIYTPTTQEYTIPLRAAVTRGGAGSVEQIQALWRPAARRSANYPSGPAAQVAGERLQSLAGMTFTTDSVFFRNDPIGYAVEIWVTAQGSNGCSLRLATYTFFNH